MLSPTIKKRWRFKLLSKGRSQASQEFNLEENVEFNNPAGCHSKRVFVMSLQERA